MGTSDRPGPRLAWQRDSGQPLGTGICLSGGGLRSASFVLGVVQALQEERGLLFGPRSVDYLSAVSGGSYTAATLLLEASRQAALPGGADPGPAPLAPGTPEERHILDHAMYFARDRLRLVDHVALSLLAVAAMFAWVGFFLANAAAIAELAAREGVPGLASVAGPGAGLPPVAAVLAVIAGLALIARGIAVDSPIRRFVLPAAGGLLFFAGSGVTMRELADRWTVQVAVLAASALLLALAIVAIATYLARARGVSGLPAVALNWLNLLVPRSLGLVLVAAVAVPWYPELQLVMEEAAPDPALVGLGAATLVGPLILGYLVHRISLHHEYRRRVGSCFAIRRDGESISLAPNVLLSELVPASAGDRRFPRLLICTTANVSHRLANGPSSFVPFVLSHDVCGVPGVADACFETTKLEWVMEPGGLWPRDREPAVTLMTAVATTGAAVAPSMGRFTVPSVQMLAAAVNLRSGRWLPNPLSVRTRRQVAQRDRPSPLDHDHGFGFGYNELIPEMFGIAGKRVYVSDGGHYDNLGLLALLGAKCAEIWCVEAAPDPHGDAPEIRRVLAEAVSLGLVRSVEIDLDVFRAQSPSMYRATHAIGRVSYPDGTVARLIVIKLGFWSGTPAELVEYAGRDRGFPHHATWKQVYSRDRMDAYRRLGWDNAVRCSRELA